MGCGQSKKIHLYPRKNKSKSNGKKGHDEDQGDEEEQVEGRENEHQQKEKEKIDDDLQQLSEQSSPEPNSNEVMIPILKNKNGPILQNPDVSSSQQNFFKMLDQKIEQGPDYDSSNDYEEEIRLSTLVQHWESASLSASMCSSTSRSLQNTPVRQAPLNNRHSQIRQQFQQPLSAELLSQQQQMMKQIQQHQANQIPGGLSINSPKRVELNPSNRQLLTQTIIHQTYGVQAQPQMSQGHILAQYQSQQQSSLTTNMQLRQLSASSVIPSSYSPPIPGATQPNANRNLACLQMSYYSQQPQFGEGIHSVPQQGPPSASEPRFPPAISVNRLAPQLQRQLRETQELIKDCTPLYGAYPTIPITPSSSNATQIQIRSQTRTGLSRRPQLETQYSESS